VWAKPLANDEWAVAFLNRGEVTLRNSYDWLRYPIGDGQTNRNVDAGRLEYHWTELWTHATGSTAHALELTLPPHAISVYRLAPVAGAKARP